MTSATEFELSASTTGGSVTNGTLTFSGCLAADDNMFIGHNSGGGTWVAEGVSEYNVAIGNSTMDSALNGASSNVAIGFESLSSLTTSGDNVSIGYQAGKALTTGDSNVVIGSGAADVVTTMANSVVIGQNAMASVPAGQAVTGCVVIGKNALAGSGSTTTGANYTTAIGYGALNALTTGASNLAIGYQAMIGHTTGSRNTAIGHGAMDATTGTPAADDNTFVGANAGGGSWSTTGSYNNVGIGSYSMTDSLQAADNNTGVGMQTFYVLTTGDSNVAVGSKAGKVLTTGSGNTLIGFQADVDAVGDSYQVRLGHYGGVRWCTTRVTLDDSYTGTPANGDAAHSNALFVIPAYSFITKVSLSVVTLSANADADFMIAYSATTNTASGTGLTS